jgi:hypothetical protein
MHRRHAAIHAIQNAGGSLSSEYDLRCMEVALSRDLTVPLAPAVRTWQERILGDAQVSVELPAGELPGSTFDAIASLHELRKLFISGTNANDDDLAKLRGLRHIESLLLSGCPITDQSAETLSQFQELRWLELDDTRISDDAVPHLAKLKKLEVLRIRGTNISDRGASQLTSLTGLREFEPSGFCAGEFR